MSAPTGNPTGNPTGSSIAVEDVVVVHDVLELPASRRRRIAIGSVLVVLGLFLALLLAKGAKGGVDTGFVLSPSGAAVDIPVVNLPARVLCIVLGLVVVALGIWQIARGFSKVGLRWVGGVAAVAFVLALLAWASTGRPDQPVSVIALLVQTVFLATPLILGAMAGVLCERSGVINVAIEGQMLAGAWAGALFGTVAHNLGVGVIAAVLAGGLLGLLLAVFSIRYLVNQVVLGVVLNLLALGLTGYIFDVLMQRDQDGLNNPGFFNPVKIPVLGDIPIVGPLLFDANVIVYLMYVIVIAIDVALFRTRWGLRTRAVGEHPKAADTVGVNVLRVRYRNVVFGGFVAGLAGAALTIGSTGQFQKNVSSGQGFIALAALIFGRWSPRGAVGAALFFGFASALQNLLSALETPVQIPSYFLAMTPYLATIIAVAGLVGRVRAPAADGEPYVKG
jgi:general nucleoside transport system permease protein